MDIDSLVQGARRSNSPLPIFCLELNATDWLALATQVRENRGRLVSLWISENAATEGYTASVAYALRAGLLRADLILANDTGGYPDLSALFPEANRMQRAMADLVGVQAIGAGDVRPWLNHGAWPADVFPLRRAMDRSARFPECGVVDYPFVRVTGDGVHEIPVGPVHAGIIEPGHFRFSIVGEKVLRLEQRLGYKHKGIDMRFQGMDAAEGSALASRVSGDTTVAYAWAYCMALESIADCTVSPRAQWLRALMLERERVANHLGDLGALGNDAAYGFGLAQFLRLKEDWLRLNKRVFGHRFMMDRVVPGGVAVDVSDAARATMRRQCEEVEADVRELMGIYEAHAGLQDRFITTGIVKLELAQRLGLTGLAARASGIPVDLRDDFPLQPYATLGFNMAGHRNGDVAARAQVRFDEVFESLRLIRGVLDQLPDGALRVEIGPPATGNGLGWIEGWRGEVLVALETRDGIITRCHCHDPSWHNWPVLEYAVIGNIVPDFPLINKSFNLSYAGHDR